MQSDTTKLLGSPWPLHQMSAYQAYAAGTHEKSTFTSSPKPTRSGPHHRRRCLHRHMLPPTPHFDVHQPALPDLQPRRSCSSLLPDTGIAVLRDRGEHLALSRWSGFTHQLRSWQRGRREAPGYRNKSSTPVRRQPIRPPADLAARGLCLIEGLFPLAAPLPVQRGGPPAEPLGARSTRNPLPSSSSQISIPLK